MQATWYFDLISPYAYLHFKLHERIAWPTGILPQIEYVPVLFAGLLKAHGSKGPAEIAEKRRHTYRMCVWFAQHHGIPLRMPPAHPFNPLHTLRLLTGVGATRDNVAAALDCIWRDGCDVNSPEVFSALARQLGVADPQALIASAAVKQQLIANTERALQRGIYGVPTFDIGGELFWGADTLPLMQAWLADRLLFKTGEMARVDALPVAARRGEGA